jgi:hypothetical protein
MHFCIGLNSGYTAQELSKLIGTVSWEETPSECMSKCIEFAINVIDSLKTRKTGEVSLQQIMLGRDIDFVSAYLADLKKIDSNSDESFFKAAVHRNARANQLRKGSDKGSKISAPNTVEIRNRTQRTGPTKFLGKKQFLNDSKILKLIYQAEYYTRKFFFFARKKAKLLLHEFLMLFVKPNWLIKNYEKYFRQNRKSILKTGIGCVFIAFFIYAIYSNLLREAGFTFFTPLLESFSRVCPIGRQ